MTRLVALTTLALVLTAGYASAATMTSGRPAAVLTKSQCKAVWKAAVPSGRYRANAAPYVVNFKLADGPDQDESDFQARVQEGLRQRPCEIPFPLAARLAGRHASPTGCRRPARCALSCTRAVQR